MSNGSPFDAAKLFSAKGLVAVVTGGGTGLGLMMARALEHNGAEKVYILGRRKDILENAAKTNNNHGRIIPIVADVTSKESLQAAVDQITAETGYINLLIANSGVTGPLHNDLTNSPEKYPDVASVRALLWDNHDETSWNQAYDVNITGAYLTTIAFLTLLDEGNKKKNVVQTSQVIAVSSIAGFMRMVSAGFAYNATKAGVTHLMKVLASVLVGYGIRVNILAPGIFPSQMTAGLAIDGRNSSSAAFADRKIPAKMIPMERAGRDEEIAGSILWLAGEGGGYTSGNVLVVDGGRLSVHPATY
ncbi:hypothetical protein DFH27DRAFT_518186 [Peziza echinospora]|nr:hypothetical protein DFH27DRAFT_518186 [Peziza echinospora]